MTIVGTRMDAGLWTWRSSFYPRLLVSKAVTQGH